MCFLYKKHLFVLLYLWGGVQVIPPPLISDFIQSYNIWCIFGKPLGWTLLICKKWANLQNSKYILQFQVIKQKMWQRWSQHDNMYILGPYHSKFKEIWKCENSLERHQCKNLCKISSACFLLLKAFHRALKSINPMKESRSNFRYRVKVK